MANKRTRSYFIKSNFNNFTPVADVFNRSNFSGFRVREIKHSLTLSVNVTSMAARSSSSYPSKHAICIIYIVTGLFYAYKMRYTYRSISMFL